MVGSCSAELPTAELVAPPQSRDDSMSADYYQEIADVEPANSHGFSATDGRCRPYGDDHAQPHVNMGSAAVEDGPIVVLSTMGMATEKSGRSTCSIHYFEPFDVRAGRHPRPHDGRAAWNASPPSTTVKRSNGQDQHLEHDLRYDRADEFMEVVLGHWILGGRRGDHRQTSGRFADPTKVNGSITRGVLQSRGRSPCRARAGHPVVIRPARPARPALRGPPGRGDLYRGGNLANAKQGFTRSGPRRPKRGAIPDQMFLCNLDHAGLRRDQSEAEDRWR